MSEKSPQANDADSESAAPINVVRDAYTVAETADSAGVCKQTVYNEINDGRLIACDISEEFTARARPYWEEAGVAGKIDLRLGPAIETLDGLVAGGESGTFDFAFIDADKTNYAGYFQRALELVRPGGLIVVDNVLWSGAVADPARDDEDTQAIRAFNAALSQDPRISLSLLPVADGLTLARKR